MSQSFRIKDQLIKNLFLDIAAEERRGRKLCMNIFINDKKVCETIDFPLNCGEAHSAMFREAFNTLLVQNVSSFIIQIRFRLVFILYFFRVIAQKYLPNRCKNCGKFFLIRGLLYYTYFDNLLADESDKTCRDVGSSTVTPNNARTIQSGRPIIAPIKITTPAI